MSKTPIRKIREDEEVWSTFWGTDEEAEEYFSDLYFDTVKACDVVKPSASYMHEVKVPNGRHYMMTGEVFDNDGNRTGVALEDNGETFVLECEE